MSSLNTYREPTTADYLNEIRKDQAASKAGNTSQKKFTPNYIITPSDTVTLSDAATSGALMGITSRIADGNLGVGGFVGYYKFDGDLTDSSGTGNNGAMGTGSAAYTNGQIGGWPTPSAFSFDGTIYVRVPNNATLHLSAMTIAFWVYMPANQSQTVQLVGRGDWGVQRNYTVVMYSGSDRRIEFNIGNNVGNGFIISNTGVSPGVWTHVCCIFDGVSAWAVYLQGAVDNSFTAAWTPYTAATTDLTIGAANNGLAQFVGYIDDLRIYNFAIAPIEVQRLYQNGLAKIGSLTDSPFGAGFGQVM